MRASFTRTAPRGVGRKDAPAPARSHAETGRFGLSVCRALSGEMMEEKVGLGITDEGAAGVIPSAPRLADYPRELSARSGQW